MTALAQGSAGVALVMSFALLGTRQIGTATILLAVQSAAMAVSAASQHQPLIAIATILVSLAGATWVLRDQAPDFQVITTPIGGTKLGIVAGAVLAVLCQSTGPLAQPLAVVLLSVLLAATRRHPLMHLVALVALQNGIAAAACLMVHDPLAALAGFFPAIPLAAGLALERIARQDLAPPRLLHGRSGWLQLTAAAAVLGITLTIPLDPLARVFAPLIAVWGVAEAWAMRNRHQTITHRGAALMQLVSMVIATVTKQPAVAVLAVAVASAAALLPTLRRRWEAMLLACSASGLALFGVLTLQSGQPLVACTALFLGIAAIAATAPAAGMIAAIVVIRQVAGTALPPVAGTILIGISLAGLLCCAVALMFRTTPYPAALLRLAQVSIIGITLGIGQPQALFAGCFMLILLILTDTAHRLARSGGAHGAATAATFAGLGGIPPFGVFPGLVLSLLAIGAHAPWLLIPVGLGFGVMLTAALPRQLPTWSWTTARSAAWLPLGVALLLGFCAPDSLVRWFGSVTAGAP